MFHNKSILLLAVLITTISLSGCTAPAGSASPSASAPQPQPEVSSPTVSLPAEPDESVIQPDIPPSVSQPAQPEPEPCKHAKTTSVLSRAATCTQQGHENWICTDCGEVVISGNIPPLGHDYVQTATVDAACETQGSRTTTCSRCNDVQTETVAAPGHSWSEAACGASATCKTCGISAPDTVQHNWVVKYALGTPECERCGTKYTFDKLVFQSNTLNVPLLAGTKRITILDMQVDVRAFEGPFNTNSTCRVDISVVGMASNACTLTRGSHLIAEDGTKINSIYENHGTTNPVCDGSFDELFSFDIPSCEGTYTVVFSAQ